MHHTHFPDTHPIGGTHPDVVIVGGRAAGAATAMLLARHGLRVLVLERSAAGTDPLSTHALMRGGVLQLQRWGLLDTIIGAGTPAVRRTTFTYTHDSIDIDIKSTNGVDALYAPRRTLLDPTLVSAAIDAGAEIRYRSTVTELLRFRDRVCGVRVRRADGRMEDIAAHLVIGADGVNSIVAELTGAPILRRGRYAAAATYGYWSDLETNGYEWQFLPDACSGVIPTNGGQACVFAGGSPERIASGGVALIEQLVAAASPELAARLGSATPPDGTRTWRGRRGYMRRSHGPGWALVGDAAYFKDPISAHGLTDALRDAELLARAVVLGLHDDLDARLAGYEEIRDRLSIPLFHITDRIASNDWTDEEIADLLRQLSASMADEVDTIAAFPLPPTPTVATSADSTEPATTGTGRR